MIHSIRCDIETFKNLELHEGFNLLLCETTQDSTDKQTRNRAGKSSLIEIIHFLLGAKSEPDSIFRSPALANATFTLRFDLAGSPVTVARSGKDVGVVYFLEGDFSAWPLQPKLRVPGEKPTPKPRKKSSKKAESESDKATVASPLETTDSVPLASEVTAQDAVWSLSNPDWCRVLGQQMFGLESELNAGENADGTSRYVPTFRSLFPYFARRRAAGGFIRPQHQSEDQQVYDEQAALLFLLDFDWQFASQWKSVRDREKSLGELKKAAKAGALGTVVPKSSSLQTEVVRAEDEINRLSRAVNEFKIVEGYREFKEEADRLTTQINGYSDENTLDNQLIVEHEKALGEEKAPTVENLQTLYAEAGIVFPEAVKARLEDARKFHESIVSNRHSYLQQEIDEAKSRTAKRDALIQVAESRRSELFALIKEGGALDQYTQLSQEIGRAESRRTLAEERYRAARSLETGASQLKAERGMLLLQLSRHFDEREAAVRHAIRLFEEVSQSLHEENAGSLTIQAEPNGPHIDFEIQGGRSGGINNMQIFCFDLVLARLCAERGIGPGFLVHDSHLFDGVDNRQSRWAFEKGAAWAKEFGFQYIVTLNSDDRPEEFSPGFNLEEFILPIRLTDARENGGLFGFRFG